MLPPPASSSPAAVVPPGTPPLCTLSLGTSFELTRNQTVHSMLPRFRSLQRQTLVRPQLQSDRCKLLPPPTTSQLSSPAAACLMRYWQIQLCHQVEVRLMQRHSRRHPTASNLLWGCHSSRPVVLVRCIHPLPPGWTV